MTLAEAIGVLKAEKLVDGADDQAELAGCFAADLMSDVLAYAKAGSMLLTGLTNTQVVRTANVLDIAAIILVRGKKPSQETVTLAHDLKIPILTTKYILFETAGRLYMKGIVGCLPKVENTSGRN